MSTWIHFAWLYGTGSYTSKLLAGPQNSQMSVGTSSRQLSTENIWGVGEEENNFYFIFICWPEKKNQNQQIQDTQVQTGTAKSSQKIALSNSSSF